MMPIKAIIPKLITVYMIVPPRFDSVATIAKCGDKRTGRLLRP
jgi:hypothetical protein